MTDTIDYRSKRAQSSRGRRNVAAKPSETQGQEETVDEKMNFRVKERIEDTTKKSRISGLLRETPIKGLLNEGTAETLKRPLTGMSNLFRRPASRAGAKRNEEEAAEKLSDRANSPLPPRNQTPPAPPVEFMTMSEGPSNYSAYEYINVESISSKKPYLVNIDDVDISLLSRFLCTEEEIQDENVPWNWDYLYTTLCAEMREEWNHKEE